MLKLLNMVCCVGLVSIISSKTALADPQIQQEFATLSKQGSQAIAAAVTPVALRYQDALKSLLAQAKDDADKQVIQAEIDRNHLLLQPVSTLEAMLPGTHWQWYDSPRPMDNKSEVWIEFYRGGLARTSWGDLLTYTVAPPANVRVNEANPEKSWFFTVDLGKKEAIADPYASVGGEQRSLRYDHGVSPVAPPK